MDHQEAEDLENSFIVIKNIDHIIQDPATTNDIHFSLSFYNLHQNANVKQTPR